jgi:hypothetical protein|nr:MAG TPA: hypothetical protein [Caudoviricetes sp.]
MKNKELKIKAPEGYEIDRDKSTFEKIVFKKVKKELAESWEELETIEGSYINNYSRMCDFRGFTKEDHKNVFPTREEAEACVALAQLCQLRDRYNDGWKPDWKNNNEIKYCIEFFKEKINKNYYYVLRRVLCFKTEELRDKFLENFSELIETAKPLL